MSGWSCPGYDASVPSTIAWKLSPDTQIRAQFGAIVAATSPDYAGDSTVGRGPNGEPVMSTRAAPGVPQDLCFDNVGERLVSVDDRMVDVVLKLQPPGGQPDGLPFGDAIATAPPNVDPIQYAAGAIGDQLLKMAGLRSAGS